MKKFYEGALLKAVPLLIITGILLLLTIPNPLQVMEENKEQEPQVHSQETVNQDSSSEVKVENENGENSVKVDVNNNVKSSETNNTSTPGTCSVTVNGETKIVPADQVEVNETGPEDKNVVVNCESKANTGSNQTTVKNKIDINTSSQ